MHSLIISLRSVVRSLKASIRIVLCLILLALLLALPLVILLLYFGWIDKAALIQPDAVERPHLESLILARAEQNLLRFAPVESYHRLVVRLEDVNWLLAA